MNRQNVSAAYAGRQFEIISDWKDINGTMFGKLLFMRSVMLIEERAAELYRKAG